MARTAFWLGFGSAVSIVFSIALSQLLLALALITLQLPPRQFRFPPVKLQLALFFGYTAVSLLLSGHPVAGWPQIRKFFVWGIVLVIASTFRSVQHVRLLCVSWAAVGCVSVGIGIEQLINRFQQARAQGWGGYGFYLDSRLTGLSSHWMTYGGELMIISLLTLSFVLFSRPSKWRRATVFALPILWIGIILGLTRSIFLFALPLGSIYLLWGKRRAAVLVAASASFILFATPVHVKDRVLSTIHPHGTVDSNSRRIIMARTGLAMIRAHPWFGLGPEQVGTQFLSYVPKDIPRPLPKGWYGHLHNIYLQYAAERGVPALAIILWLIAVVIRDLHDCARTFASDPRSWPLRGCVAVVIATLAEGFFEHNLGDSEVLTMFLTTIACGYVVKWELESNNTREIWEYRLRPLQAHTEGCAAAITAAV
jgi:putative inorganic carbon (hco3(-)) transporter